MSITPNALFHADCLDLMQRLGTECIDLVYLDPPYPSAPDPSPKENGSPDWRRRLSWVCQQSKRVLKATGVLYFHTQPQWLFFVRLLLNQVFGEKFYHDEIVWQPKSRPLQMSRSRADYDVIVCYTKSDISIRKPVLRSLTRDESLQRFTKSDERGPFTLTSLTGPIDRPNLRFAWRGMVPAPGQSWRFNLERLEELETEGRVYRDCSSPVPKLKSYLTEHPGIEIGNIWTDIPRLSPQSSEAVNFSTQKPLGLIERLLHRSSEQGSVVLDPFCGSGTTIVAAERHHRKWITCDNSKEAVEISLQRLQGESQVSGEPNYVFDAEDLKKYPVKSKGFERLAIRLSDFNPSIQFEYIINRPVPFEESQHFEFKEIKSPRGAIDNVVNASDEYAVGFLNSEGGSILWGIRDDRIVVGVQLNSEQRDILKRNVLNKLATIQPAIDPSEFQITIHEIHDEHGGKITDLCVVELTVPASDSDEPYYTSSGQLFVKLNGLNKLLKGPSATQFIRNWAVRKTAR